MESSKSADEEAATPKNNSTQDVSRTPEDMLLDMIPEPKKEEAMSIIRAMVVMHSESFSGPIPPPSILKEYEEMQPGAADRILKMAENQAEHRMELEKKAIGGQIKQSSRGQIFGLIIIILLIIAAFAFAYFFGMTEFAAKFLSWTMVIIVGIFVSGKVLTFKDLKEKSKDQEK